MADGSKLEKTFDPSSIEARLYDAWENEGCFKVGRVLEKNPEAEPYTIVIPPPNVTGSLHMGHALNNTLQDILCRFERMRGRDVLWQPGTDHAGIATQMVVERQLAEQGNESRRDMGREKFLERVWQWKEESGSTITRQLRRLGASCDWSRERFTMDEGLSKAVLKVFVTLYEQGLIYKDKRLVNWDPGLLTAISDLEVEQRETNSHMWHFNYPLEDGPLANGVSHITVATTRPETMLGDTGVAVHPEDERYKELIGKNVLLPIVGRLIPIVADEYADPEKGSGAVKITPAHDFNDFEVGKRCGLAAINMLDQHAAIDLSDDAFDTMDSKADWHGLDRYEARKKIVATLEEMGLVDKIEPDTHMVPYGDRSNQVIEPWLTDQWYVDAETMAKPAIEAVTSGATKFVPPNWDKTYFEWMNNIQPWCISRQLWWGHQIPAWYDEDGKVYVAESEEAAQAQAGEGVALTRDEDVLDTWFSSALWPFSTLGWTGGDESEETQAFIKRHYKTDVLVTGFDIIFFWVARMMMSGLHFMDDENGQSEVPFHTVYVHALVRDEKGAKMSKSKGNVVDPLEIIDKYGADALRFTLSAMAAMGRDIKLSESRVEGYRNFATKLWNAARFCEMNECFEADDFDPAQASLPLTQWLVGEVVRAQNAVTQALEAYRFNDASNAVYQFIWNSFCDWYVELAKPALQSDGQGEDAAEKAEVQAATKWAMENALRLLHPFMPFVTEEVWAKTAGNNKNRDNHLMLDVWPSLSGDLINPAADGEINWLIEAIGEIRSVRSEMNVPAGAQVPLVVVGANDATKARLGETDIVLKRLARLADISEADAVPDGAVQTILGEATLAIPLADIIDVDAEKARLKKDIGKVEGEIKKISGKLGNQGFLDKAPEAVIEENKARLAEEEARRDKLQSALERLG